MKNWIFESKAAYWTTKKRDALKDYLAACGTARAVFFKVQLLDAVHTFNDIYKAEEEKNEDTL
jgi:hypothetical protein